jgi:capsular polysaccharide biosynthesis protein/predicted nucleic acid-binding protein
MDAASVWKAITTRWLIVAGVAVFMAMLAGAMTMVRQPMYTATAEGLVSISHPETRPPWALTNGSQYIVDRMTSYAQLGGTTPVILPVYGRLHLHETLVGRVASEWATDKALLRISVTYSDPAFAARIADGILQQLGSTIERIENGNIVVTQVTPATVPSAPSNHNLMVNVPVAGAAGLILGVFAAVGLEAMSDRAGRRAAGRQWVMDATAYTHLCRAGYASLIERLAPDSLVLVPTYVNIEIENDRARYPEIPSVESVRWARLIVPTEEENETQIQLKAQIGGAIDEHLGECSVIACALHRNLVAVLGEDVAIGQAHQLGVRTRSVLWIVVEAYNTVYNRDRDLAAALVDDLLATGMRLPFESGESLFSWAEREGVLS